MCWDPGAAVMLGVPVCMDVCMYVCVCEGEREREREEEREEGREGGRERKEEKEAVIFLEALLSWLKRLRRLLVCPLRSAEPTFIGS